MTIHGIDGIVLRILVVKYSMQFGDRIDKSVTIIPFFFVLKPGKNLFILSRLLIESFDVDSYFSCYAISWII